MAASAILDNFEWPYLRNGSRSTYIARGHLCDSTAFLFDVRLEEHSATLKSFRLNWLTIITVISSGTLGSDVSSF